MQQLPLVLGSGSPRRKELLGLLGLPIFVDPPAVDESVFEAETPEVYVSRVGGMKLQDVVGRWRKKACLAVLTADTIVTYNGRILTKPTTTLEAEKMLAELSGKSHQVLTAYQIWSPHNDQTISRIEATTVTFRPLSEAEMHAYAKTGEGLDKAGGYAIQGGAMAFVEKIDGAYSNVVGLPISRVLVDLYDLGLVESARLFAKIESSS